MREHGVLRRILLIYEESIRRIDTDEALPLDSVADASGIIHDFVENYHEKPRKTFSSRGSRQARSPTSSMCSQNSTMPEEGSRRQP